MLLRRRKEIGGGWAETERAGGALGLIGLIAWPHDRLFGGLETDERLFDDLLRQPHRQDKQVDPCAHGYHDRAHGAKQPRTDAHADDNGGATQHPGHGQAQWSTPNEPGMGDTMPECREGHQVADGPFMAQVAILQVMGFDCPAPRHEAAPAMGELEAPSGPGPPLRCRQVVRVGRTVLGGPRPGACEQDDGDGRHGGNGADQGFHADTVPGGGGRRFSDCHLAAHPRARW